MANLPKDRLDSSSKLNTRNLIPDSRKLQGSRLESSFETFEAFREFIETIQESFESSFETCEWENQGTFRAIKLTFGMSES